MAIAKRVFDAGIRVGAAFANAESFVVVWVALGGTKRYKENGAIILAYAELKTSPLDLHLGRA